MQKETWKMKMKPSFVLLSITSFAAIHLINAQNQDGFISIDCGLMPNDSTYTDPNTGLKFLSDVGFIETGESRSIEQGFMDDNLQHLWTLRSFPEGKRNCYDVNVTLGVKYLIRARFRYGNYDGQDESPSFDLHLGPNKWASVASEWTDESSWEIIHVPTSSNLQVCLVKTGTTTPFISSLELRPLNNNSYVTQSGSLSVWYREYRTDGAKDVIRFDKDIHDRIWTPNFFNIWTEINTTLPIDADDDYDVPQPLLRTAAVPSNASEPLTISWYLTDPASEVFVYLHFVEIEKLKANETREFNISLDGKPVIDLFSPRYLHQTTISNKDGLSCTGGYCVLKLIRTARSTHPPLLGPSEAYELKKFPQAETDQNDVNAIKNLKATYKLRKISWQGDPCAPREFLWDGLNCSGKNISDPPRITSLNLSSSRLSGFISLYMQNLTQLMELDLSNNSLTGEVPKFLAEMKLLSVINLSGNRLNGSVPQALIDREKDGSLKLNVQGNPNLYCPPDACENKDAKNKAKRKNILVPFLASVASLSFIIAALVLLFFLKTKKPRRTEAAGPSTKSPKSSEPPIITKEKRFSYFDVATMTNNFERALGKGGFGVVYHGRLNDTEQVAVKMLSQSSAQGYKEFKAEVELLLRVHHKNLVELVGYCDEGDNLALIYEYMDNGDLNDHLSGKHSSHVLSWSIRLKIAAEAAQGLEYMHNGCKPPMVHRDVKTTNILLNKHFEAKLADFGLSRSFPADSQSYVSTVVAGTPGYLDPVYHGTNLLTKKSDVYSFGIVLLKILANRPVIDNTLQKPHIADRAASMLREGDIRNIMDQKLNGEFDTNSVWRALEVAMACVNPFSSRRPSMGYVVTELNECLRAEKARTGGSPDMEPNDVVGMSLTLLDEFSPEAR